MFLRSSALRRLLFLAVVVSLVGFVAGCGTESPSAPDTTFTPLDGDGTGDSFLVTIEANPASALADGTSQVVVRGTVRNSAGQSPPEGAALVFTTSIGSFSGTSSSSVSVGTVNGRASVGLVSGQGGSGTVRATYVNRSATVGIAFGDNSFFVQSIDPNTGSPSGGETARVRGTGFRAPLEVTIGGNNAVVQSVSPGSIRVLTPVFDLGDTPSESVDVVVSHLGTNEPNPGESATLAAGFTYTSFGGGDSPRVFSVNPATGSNEGGNTVTINGDGFEAPVRVEFGGAGTQVEATVVSVSPTQIVVTAPPATGLGSANAGQVVDVTVTNLNSGRAVVAAGAYTYGPNTGITAVQPSRGPRAGGTNVTIFGSGFSEPLVVQIGGIDATVVSVSPTQVVVTTGEITTSTCADVPSDVVVTNTQTGQQGTGPTFTYEVLPLNVTGVSPSSGPQAGGTTLALPGSGYSDSLSLTFDGAAGTFLSASPTSMSARSPAFPNAGMTENACDDNTDTVQGLKYQNTAVTIDINDLKTGCTASLAGAFTFTPSDVSCRGD